MKGDSTLSLFLQIMYINGNIALRRGGDISMNKVLKSLAVILLVLPLVFSFASTSQVQAASTKVAYVDITSGVLNVRSGASTTHTIVGSLKDNAKVTVYSVTKSGWAEINYKSQKRYVSNQYLRYYHKMSEKEAKKITDRVIKIQNSLKGSYTKQQIYSILSPGFTDAFIEKLYKYDLMLWEIKSGKRLYGWRGTDFPAYMIMYGITWDKNERIKYKIPAPKITYYKKNGQEYLIVSQKYSADELYENVEQKIYLSKTNSKAYWKVYHTSW